MLMFELRFSSKFVTDFLFLVSFPFYFYAILIVFCSRVLPLPVRRNVKPVKQALRRPQKLYFSYFLTAIILIGC